MTLSFSLPKILCEEADIFLQETFSFLQLCHQVCHTVLREATEALIQISDLVRLLVLLHFK